MKIHLKHSALMCCIMLVVAFTGCSDRTNNAIENKYQGSSVPVNGEIYNTSSIYADITITAGTHTLHAILFNNKTAKTFADMLPLSVPTWHPAPDFARAFDLPEMFPYFEDEPAQMSYELGSLAYWQPGPSIAMIYNASRTQTVVPVVPIGKITDDVSIFFQYSGTITIELQRIR